MVIDHCENGAGSTACWHSCSLCRTVRLTSAPADTLPGRHHSATAESEEEDSGYAGDPPPGLPDIEA